MDTPQPIPLPSIAPRRIAEDALDSLLTQVDVLAGYAGVQLAGAPAAQGQRPGDAPLLGLLETVARFARDGGPAAAVPEQVDALRDALYSRAMQRRTSRDPDGAQVDRRAAILGFLLTVTRARHSLALGHRVSVRELAALGGVSSRDVLLALGLEPEPGLRIDALSARRWLRGLGVKGYER